MARIRSASMDLQSNAVAEKSFEDYKQSVLDLVHMDESTYHGALKVLHEPQDARDDARAEERIKREIQAMSEISHPNLLKILDSDTDGKWFVSEFYEKGSLDKSSDLFTGNPAGALRAFRPLVDGVAELHKADCVHRDIKPGNVFIDEKDNLVLGDFGLMYFADDQHTRLSGTWENVGSRDWMPIWAQGQIQDATSAFDVFSLGKLLWSMISDTPFLRAWYFREDEFNLEMKFPKSKYTHLLNSLLDKCVVERESDCLPSAGSLLEEVDEVLSVINANADLIHPEIERKCKVCGRGTYQMHLDQENPHSFGLNHVSGYSYKIFLCDNCGHMQTFAFRGSEEDPPAWANDRPVEMDGMV